MNDNEIKVSQLAEAEELNENDIFMIVQAGVNKKLQGRKIGGNEIVISTTEEDITSKTKLFINSLTSEAKYRDGSDWISLAGDEVIIGTESDITDNTKILIEEVPEGSNIPYLNSEIAIGSSNEDNRPVWFKQSKNLFNKDNILSGYYIDASGNLISAPDNYVGNDFIKIDNTKTYYVSGGQNNVIRICYYTTSQTFISRELITSSGILTIPNNTMYVKISSYTSNLSTLQLEQNSTATTYEPYIRKTININGKDEYYTNDYSTAEQVIGTFLGKPLYRKIIIASNLTINQNNDTTFDDTNLEIRNIGGRIIGGGSNFVAPVNSVWNTSDLSNGRCSCYYITNGKLRSYCGAFLTNNNKYDLEAVIEYTKTTD